MALAGWVAFVPRLETIVEHRIAALQPAVVGGGDRDGAGRSDCGRGGVVAGSSSRARARRGRAVGRPATPRQGRRSAALGGALLAIGLGAIALSRHGKTPWLIIGGLVLTSAGVLLLGPIAIGGLAVAGRRSPVAIRLALRDLARYRARSGAALAAITLVTGIVAAIAISAAAAAQNEGPAGEAGWTNLPANQLMIYLSPGGSYDLARDPSAAQRQPAALPRRRDRRVRWQAAQPGLSPA